MPTEKQKIYKICEHCGNMFEAKRTSTRYCSHKCNSAAYKVNKRKAVIRLSEDLTVKKKTATLKTDLSDQVYLGISEAAKLLGLSRWTIYRCVIAGDLPSLRITKRTTRIKRSDLEAFFANALPYEIEKQSQERKVIADWYSLEEITEKYGLQYRQVRKIINSEKIPEKKNGRFTLISKIQIDNYFKKRGYNNSISNLSSWLTITEIMTEYSMTEASVYSFLSDYKIPKKQLKGKRYYSKYHIDNLKNKKP